MKTIRRKVVTIEMPDLGLTKAQLTSLRRAFKQTLVHTLKESVHDINKYKLVATKIA